ncbi:hypothetical protein [Prosthecochloris aestuarii]|uniref:hypothetical protein n=1 Tax=Prosthecochloris aestuarii TaxID=1102 RepID=UPI00123195F3|nr:hypothetical protein [Prosthecochloris aestuarii]
MPRKRPSVFIGSSSERFRQITEAASGFDNASKQMHTLIKLLSQSRKVELDIISSQFGAFIDPAKLSQMKVDLENLDLVLSENSNERS